MTEPLVADARRKLQPHLPPFASSWPIRTRSLAGWAPRRRPRRRHRRPRQCGARSVSRGRADPPSRL